MTATAWILAAVVVVLATVVQRLTGMGFGVVAVPLLALAAPQISIFAVLVLTVVVMVATAWIERDALAVDDLLLASLVAVPGIVVGTLAVAALPDRATGLVIGGVVVAASTVSLLGWRAAPGRRTLVVGALFSGALTPLAALPGPPMAIVYRPDDVRRMRATLSAYFAVGSALTIGTLMVEGSVLPQAAGDALLGLALTPAVAAGAILAIPLVRRLSRRFVQSASLTLSLVSGAALLVRGVLAG